MRRRPYGRQLLASNASKSSGPLIVEIHMCDTGTLMSTVCVLYGGLFNVLCGFGGEAVSPVIGNRFIDDCSAIDTFPCIEDQEKV
jgi:hypothetical protein